MNHCVPDWNVGDDYMSLHAVLPLANQRKSMRHDHDLVELLWENGHVVMHSQTHRKTTTSLNEIKQCQRPEMVLKCGGTFDNSMKIVAEEETSSWLQYPVDDSLDKEFCLDLYGLPTESPTTDEIKDVPAAEKVEKHGTTEESSVEYILKQSNGLCFGENMMLPKSQVVPSLPQFTSGDAGDSINFPHFSKPLKIDLRPVNGHLGERSLGNKSQGKEREKPSTMMKEASICGSNQVHGQFNGSSCNTERVSSEKPVKNNVQVGLSSEIAHTETHETTVTSSSGGLGCSYGRTDEQNTGRKSHKRKGKDADESECQSEETECEAMESNRLAQRSTSTRRSRAAEVHNLAERRRRDRINEKMRALQELIPHCNKSDKASMLDEAIEYLKSLQLQLQMMWMRGGMAAMMFPGMQHYMSQMGMGMGHGPMPSAHGSIQFPRVPLVNQSMPLNPVLNQASVCAPFVSPLNFENQMQSSHMPESYARYLGFHHMQHSPQAMNLYSSMLMQQNQPTLGANSSAPGDIAAPSESTQNIKTG